MTILEACKFLARYEGLTVYPKSTEWMPQDMTHVREDHLRYGTDLNEVFRVVGKIDVLDELELYNFDSEGGHVARIRPSREPNGFYSETLCGAILLAVADYIKENHEDNKGV